MTCTHTQDRLPSTLASTLLSALVLRKVHRLVEEGGLLDVLACGLHFVVEVAQVLPHAIDPDVSSPLLHLLMPVTPTNLELMRML